MNHPDHPVPRPAARPVRRPVAIAAGLALALTASLAAACGTSTVPATGANPTHAARLDRSLHDLLPQSVRDKGVLRVGTDASYAPMESFGPDGRTIVGMEPDLGVEIGRVLGVRLQFQNVDFSKLLVRVAHGDPDIAMSAITDTAERAKTADFVNYFSAGTSIVVQRGNPDGISDLGDLCGRVVAVEESTTQVDLLARTQSNCRGRRIIVKTYPTNSDALVQLRTGRAAAVLNDHGPAVFLVNDVRTRSQYQLVSTAQLEPALYGIAVAKSQPRLRDAVQGALEELQRSGIYTDILTRWHLRDGNVQKITVNSSR
jgi:polar amino acid transport system substrate-binding protein